MLWQTGLFLGLHLLMAGKHSHQPRGSPLVMEVCPGLRYLEFSYLPLGE